MSILQILGWTCFLLLFFLNSNGPSYKNEVRNDWRFRFDRDFWQSTMKGRVEMTPTKNSNKGQQLEKVEKIQ